MILFNALQKSISAGIGRYSFELSKELYECLNENLKIVIREEDLEDYNFVNPKSLLIFKNIKNSKDRNIFEQYHLPKLINEKFRDYVIHYPDSMAPVFLKNNKLVITVHDLAFKTLSKTFTKKTVIWKNFMTGIAVKKAKKIIAITKFSKNELCKYYNNVEDKTRVVYNGFSNLSLLPIEEFKICEAVKSIKNKNYILTVSTISPRKNIETLINSFNNIKDYHDINLVIAGSNGWLYEKIYNLVNQLNIKDRVIFTGRINDDELKFLYKNAKVFVYPSFYEGFGLPPLESMSFSVKTIVSNTECLREVSGENCTYFDPNNHIELSNILDNSLKENNSVDYSSVLNKYSWVKCAKETIEVYNEILKGE